MLEKPRFLQHYEASAPAAPRDMQAPETASLTREECAQLIEELYTLAGKASKRAGRN